MTSVFLVFITKSFSRQNRENAETSLCSYSTPGAISTMSSANASMNRVRLATVKSRRYYLVYELYSRYYKIKAYTLSKYNANNSGLAPSPCFTPLEAVNQISASPPSPTRSTPLLSMYMFLMIATRSSGTPNSSTKACHSFSLTTLSYAFYKSIKHKASGERVTLLYYTSCYKIKAYSVVV